MESRQERHGPEWNVAEKIKGGRADKVMKMGGRGRGAGGGM